jgi:hypothetical protein
LLPLKHRYRILEEYEDTFERKPASGACQPVGS